MNLRITLILSVCIATAGSASANELPLCMFHATEEITAQINAASGFPELVESIPFTEVDGEFRRYCNTESCVFTSVEPSNNDELPIKFCIHGFRER